MATDDGVWTDKLARRKPRTTRASHVWDVTAGEPEGVFESTGGPHVPNIMPSLRHDGPRVESNLRGDYGNMALLLVLYTLQGIPLGLIASVPLLLQARKITYHQQAFFSFAYWPFSMKLLWAPIVDSVFWSRVGRRKSWLVPTQYLIGIFLIVFSYYAHEIIGNAEDTTPPDIVWLTAIFFPLNFLAATQDIAVDGWALTMLKRENVGYASTANAVGQTAGFFIGNAIFLSLESAEFCNSYLRSTPLPHGVVTLSDFVYFWGIIFLVTTTLILLLKREYSPDDMPLAINEEYEESMNVKEAYKLLWKIIRLPLVMQLVGILLTAKIAFAAADGITGLKLVEMGVPKDKLALLAIPLTPLQIALPWLLGRYTAGPRPMNVFQKAIFACVLMALVVYWTPSWQLPNGEFPPLYYGVCLAAYCVHQIASYSLFVAVMAFFAQISDPLVGGTYMTLLNTVTNLGGNWPVTLVLTATDDLTWRECRHNSTQVVLGDCSRAECTSTEGGGVCVTSIDGYYVLIALCFVLGLIWWRVTRRRITALQSAPLAAWSVPMMRTKSSGKLLQ